VSRCASTLAAMTNTTGDPRVDAVLADLARTDPDLAALARAGFESLTWGQGLGTVTLHSLAEFLWHGLPVKWMVGLEEKLQVAAGLAELFTRLELPRYAALCAAPVTAEILTAYENEDEDRTAGFKAYRAAIEATGVEAPNVPGVIEWGSIMGADEYGAFREASIALERAIETGELKPGSAGWRKTTQLVTTRFLNSRRDEVTGATWVQWIHTERLQQWMETGGRTRKRLAGAIADTLVHPLPPPADADEHLRPLRWLLNHAAAGAPLTQKNYLARPIVVEGSQRFGWRTGRGLPRSESGVIELWMLRKLAQQMRLVRRSKHQLLLSTTGKTLYGADTEDMWAATMACLPGSTEAEAAAGEVALLLMLAGEQLDYEAMDIEVAAALAEGGWRDSHTGAPITRFGAGNLLGHMLRLVEILHLATERHWNEPLLLNDAGRAAAHTALRARALRARTNPYD